MNHRFYPMRMFPASVFLHQESKTQTEYNNVCCLYCRQNLLLQPDNLLFLGFVQHRMIDDTDIDVITTDYQFVICDVLHKGGLVLFLFRIWQTEFHPKEYRTSHFYLRFYHADKMLSSLIPDSRRQLFPQRLIPVTTFMRPFSLLLIS